MILVKGHITKRYPSAGVINLNILKIHIESEKKIQALVSLLRSSV